jgi:Protein of unknown function, DUF547
MMNRIFRYFIAAFIAFLLVGCASVRAPQNVATATATSAANSAPPYEAWARVLQKYVDAEGRVNFSGLAKDRADLDRFVAYVYAIGPNNQPSLFPSPQHVLAFHINAYNALAMYKVIEVGIPQTNAGFRKVGFFYFGKVMVGGEAISLYDYENKVIRPLGDPRIHMALNCMAVSCPRLPREVFLPETLDAQLDRETRRFFNEARNAAYDAATKTVKLSEILKFFPSDFLAKAPSLVAYANLYRDQKLPDDAKVDFFDYDWTINRQPGT